MNNYLITLIKIVASDDGPHGRDTREHTVVRSFKTDREADVYAEALRRQDDAVLDGYARRLTLREEQCINCRYYHGRDEIHCTIYPSGPSSESCLDRVDRAETTIL